MYGRKTRAMTAPVLLFAAALGVCAADVYAQSAVAARVLTLNGQVSVMRDNAPWALNIGDAVQPRQMVITGPDGFAEFQVSDGSKFQIFPNSHVIFRENPPNWGQLLDVLIGRIKVHIQKLGNQPNPNSVRTPTAVISVRGTVFDVVVEDDRETTLVSVDEGQVEVANITAPGKSRLLNPGESIRVFKNVPLAKLVDKGSVAQGALRAAAQAMYEVLFRTSRTGGGSPGTIGGGGGTIGQGDKPKPEPPADAPPPPPPPPPQ
jgi:ferric-dicitrate binding protein FerR (iron transport regulator)